MWLRFFLVCPASPFLMLLHSLYFICALSNIWHNSELNLKLAVALVAF
jgi:hypothetical protein